MFDGGLAVDHDGTTDRAGILKELQCCARVHRNRIGGHRIIDGGTRLDRKNTLIDDDIAAIDRGTHEAELIGACFGECVAVQIQHGRTAANIEPAGAADGRIGR